MRIISIKNAAGIDLVINADALSYLRLDPSNKEKVMIYLNNGECHLVKSSLKDVADQFILGV